jgi:hypothetical protein
MKTGLQQVAVPPIAFDAPVPMGLLQHEYNFGNHAAADWDDEPRCAKRGLQNMQHVAKKAPPINGALPLVREVLRSPGQPLEVGMRASMETTFGHDFSQVRVHTGAKAGESARKLHAFAYTVGRDIVFSEGQYIPQTATGRELMAHELAHVVQQGQARTQLGALSISTAAGIGEGEADRAARMYQVGQPIPILTPISPAIQRQPRTNRPPTFAGGTQTITNNNALKRGGPNDFKTTGQKLPMGERVDIIDTQTTARGTFVQVVQHATGTELGWTSQMNLGDFQYAKAAASFVYMAKVKPRTARPDTLPLLVYVPTQLDGQHAVDIVLYFHGDAANYSTGKANNYDSENPAIGMNLAGVGLNDHQIIIAPQINEWGAGGDRKSPWNTLQAGDYESMVQIVFTNLQSDLGIPNPIPRGRFSIAGHSGGGKALGQAVEDLDRSGEGVTDVTLVEAGYGGGEDQAGKADGPFAKSFQLVREWLLEGKPGKVLRVITKAKSQGIDTRRAVENNPYPEPKDKEQERNRIPVLGLDGLRNAIKAKGLESELQADATEIASDPLVRNGGMRLIRKIVVRHKGGGQDQGMIYLFLMENPPRAKDVDTHFGVRNATIQDIVSGGSKGENFAALP